VVKELKRKTSQKIVAAIKIASFANLENKKSSEKIITTI